MNSRPGDYRHALIEGLDDPALRDFDLWHPQEGPQTNAFFSEADELFFGGAAGGGKLLANSATIVTPFGIKTHGDIKVSDQVCNPDGTIARVIGVYPHGEMPVYRVTFSDGASVLAGGDHLWVYWLSGKRLKADRKYFMVDDAGDPQWVPGKEIIGHNARLATTLQLKAELDKQIDRQANGKRPHWPLIPLTEPVKYSMDLNPGRRNNLIDPYVLGLLIGDGSFGDQLTFTNPEQFLTDQIKAVIGDDAIHRYDDRHHRIYARSGLREKLDFWGLRHKHAADKFIPPPYLTMSIEDRFNLMQGLMDTDGYVDDRGHMSYTTVSHQLALDVQRLARSLGAKATITDKIPDYTYLGERYQGQRAYTIYFQGKYLDRFVRLPRKRDRYKPYNGGDIPGRRVVSIELEGETECTCIKVDHFNGLYLTDDFIVTHNTDLIIGLAIRSHRKSIIFRREFPQFRDFIMRTNEILDPINVQFKQNWGRWELPGQRFIELGSVPQERDLQRYRGRPHDLIAFDEGTEFPENFYRFLMAWNRSTDPLQRCRIIMASNPPQNTTGEWVIRYWAPWIDPQHPHPAEPGELRWFIVLDNKSIEVEGPEPVTVKHRTIIPRSRTFIPSRLADNAYLRDTNYESVLMGLPDELREMLLNGRFFLSDNWDAFQVIPKAQVIMAQERWSEPDRRQRPDAVGIDPARGGEDDTAIAYLYGNTFVVDTFPGKRTPNGNAVASLVIRELAKFGDEITDIPIGVDTIGAGVSVVDMLRDNQIGRVLPIHASAKSRAKSKELRLRFVNVRAQYHFRLREALMDTWLAIPRGIQLQADLCAPRWKTTARGLMVESKEDIKKRIHRSPDQGEAIMLCHHARHNVVQLGMMSPDVW